MKKVEFVLGQDGETLEARPALRKLLAEANLSDLELLTLSIQKWEAVVSLLEKGTFVHDGSGSTCALCERPREGRRACPECPIHEETGELGCGGTPYIDWDLALDNEDMDAMLDAARDELAFLKSLREETNV